jgi:hypothetical protein
MKKLFLSAMVLCFVASLAFAQEAATLTLKGYIIDNKCAAAQSAQLDEFTKTHSKECALSPDCAASGFAIYADHQLYKFDKDSSAKIEEFLKKEDSKLLVTVEAKKAGKDLSLVSIKND